MSLSTPFIRRPVATTLLTFGLAAAGAVAFFKLPVSPLPQVDFPTISVQATLPGASPQDVATTVASPLERHLGQIADVTEMTSSSSVGSDAHHAAVRAEPRYRRRRARRAGRDQRGARRFADQSAIQSDLQEGQSRRRPDPDPDLEFGHDVTRRSLRRGIDGAGAEAVAGRGHRRSRGQRQFAARGARRPDSAGDLQIRHRPRRRAGGAGQRQRPQPEGRHRRRRAAVSDLRQRPGQQGRRLPIADRRLPQRRGGASVRCRRGHRRRREPAQLRPRQRQAGGPDHPVPATGRQYHQHGGPGEGADAAIAGVDFARDRSRNWRPTVPPPSAPRCAMSSAPWCWPCCW